jgi:hypothetical protein
MDVLSRDRLAIDWFGLLFRYIEHLRVVTTAPSLTHALYSLLQHVQSLLSLLYLRRLSPGNGFQRRSFLSFRIHVLTGRRLSHD